MAITLGAILDELSKRNIQGKWERDDGLFYEFNSREYIIKSSFEKAAYINLPEYDDEYTPQKDNRKKFNEVRITSKRPWQTENLAITPKWAKVIDYIADKNKVPWVDSHYRFFAKVKSKRELVRAFKRLESAEEELGKIVEREAKKLIEG